MQRSVSTTDLVVAMLSITCLGGMHAGAHAQQTNCTFNDNEIIQGPLCESVESNDPFCQVEFLAPVSNSNRVIWDGSFSSSDSTCEGPGGRWTGTTTRGEWDPPTRAVENQHGDGELVMRGGFDAITARVFGQTFGAAAAGAGGQGASVEVLVSSCDVIRLSFTARIENGPSDCHLCWVKVMFGELGDAGYEAAHNNEIDGAGHNEQWYIDAQGEVTCSIDLPLDQIGCRNIDIGNWIPMIQFGVGKHSQYENIRLHVDDIEMNIAEPSGTENLIHRDQAGNCGIEGNDFYSWTLITRSHWQGGGDDTTDGITSAPDACIADANCDGTVDVMDLLEVIGGWGPHAGPGDINCDGAIDVYDLITVLGGWGASCD